MEGEAVHGTVLENEDVGDTGGVSRARSLSEPKVRQVGFKPPSSPESAAVQEREGEGETSVGGSSSGGGASGSSDRDDAGVAANAGASGGGNTVVSTANMQGESKPIMHSPAAVIVPTKLNFSSATTTTTTTTTVSDERGAAATDVIGTSITGVGGGPPGVAVPEPAGVMSAGIAVGAPPTTTSAILLASSPERGSVLNSTGGGGGSSHEVDTPESLPAAVGFSSVRLDLTSS